MIIDCIEIKPSLGMIQILVVVCIPISFQGWYHIVGIRYHLEGISVGLIQAYTLVLK